MGMYWGGVSLWAVIMGCVVCGVQLGCGCVVCGLVCSTSSGFSSGLLFSVVGFTHKTYILPVMTLPTKQTDCNA